MTGENDNNREETEPLPLSPAKIPVTRFSRKAAAVVAGIVCGVTIFALIIAFSPKKEPPPQQKAQQQQEPAQTGSDPSPAECVTAGPRTYAEIKPANAVYLTPYGGVPALGAPLDPYSQQPQQPPQNGASGNGSYTYVATSTGAVLTPEQQAAITRSEERQKQASEARRSPLTFENNGKTEAPQNGGGPLPPGVDSMERVETLVKQLVPPSNDQNRQDEKRQFIKARNTEAAYLQNLILKPISPFEIKAGTILPVTLITGINSDLPGQITAQLRENVYDTVSGKYLLLPQGTRLIGEYDSKISYGQARVLVVWARLIMPNGNSINLEGMPGIDLSGYAGATGRVNNHYGKLITGVVLGSIIGAGAQIAAGGQGSPNTPASFEQLAAAGAAQNINQAGQQITQRNLNLQPTIEVPPGQKVDVFVTKDIILEPLPRTQQVRGGRQ